MDARRGSRPALVLCFILVGHSQSHARECPGALADPSVRSFGDEQDRIAETLIPALHQNYRYALEYFRSQIATIGGFNGNKSVQARIRAEPYSSFLSCFPHFRLAMGDLQQSERLHAEAEDRSRREEIARAHEEARLARDQERKLEEQREANAQRDAANQRAASARQSLRDQELAQEQEEGARLEGEARKKEVAREKAEMSPFNILIRSYSFYIYIKHCYNKRSGYVLVYINDQEMDRARDEMKIISEKIKTLDTSIDDGAAWKLGDGEASKHEITSDKCHQVLDLLDTGAKAADPEVGRTKKDF